MVKNTEEKLVMVKNTTLIFDLSFRSWFRSLLVESGGMFFDVFRAKHPERTEAYTCWATSTGGEMFNYGSRIDHIITAGSCLHENKDLEGHDFFSCHVEDCEILTQFKRWKEGTMPSNRWKEGKSIKLEGSDHAPVFMSLIEIPEVPQHNTPPLSTRYCPQVRGCQQTLVSMLSRRQSTQKLRYQEQSVTSLGEEVRVQSCEQLVESPIRDYNEMNKKSKKNQSSQLSLRSFFHSTSTSNNNVKRSTDDISLNHKSNAIETDILNDFESNRSEPGQSRCESNTCNSSQTDKSKNALLEWQRIQHFMHSSIPVYKGHSEQCVSRVVKKDGPTFGRRFYVCARGEGTASNPEENCGYFKWADSTSKRKQGK